MPPPTITISASSSPSKPGKEGPDSLHQRESVALREGDMQFYCDRRGAARQAPRASRVEVARRTSLAKRRRRRLTPAGRGASIGSESLDPCIPAREETCHLPRAWSSG